MLIITLWLSFNVCLRVSDARKTGMRNEHVSNKDTEGSSIQTSRESFGFSNLRIHLNGSISDLVNGNTRAWTAALLYNSSKVTQSNPLTGWYNDTAMGISQVCGVKFGYE
jgi:hypothetical protein